LRSSGVLAVVLLLCVHVVRAPSVAAPTHAVTASRSQYPPLNACSLVCLCLDLQAESIRVETQQKHELEAAEFACRVHEDTATILDSVRAFACCLLLVSPCTFLWRFLRLAVVLLLCPGVARLRAASACSQPPDRPDPWWLSPRCVAVAQAIQELQRLDKPYVLFWCLVVDNELVAKIGVGVC
jgi:hypothetical protein